jgi:hypothetical protein
MEPEMGSPAGDELRSWGRAQADTAEAASALAKRLGPLGADAVAAQSRISFMGPFEVEMRIRTRRVQTLLDTAAAQCAHASKQLESRAEKSFAEAVAADIRHAAALALDKLNPFN